MSPNTDPQADSGKGETGDLPRWDLSDLFPGPDSPEFTDCLARIQELSAQFTASHRERIGTLDSDGLLACIREYETIRRLVCRAASFVRLRYATDTLDPKRGKLLGDVRAKIAEWNSPLAFFEVEINQLETDRLECLLEENSELNRYRPLLHRIRKFRPHQLSAELEHYSSEISAASAASIVRLFDETCASMRFRVAGKTLNLAQTLDLMNLPDRKMRQAASKALTREIDSRLPLFTLVINTVAKEGVIDDRWRKFNTPQASRHLANDVEGEVVDAMLEAVTGSYGEISHRYYRLKSRWLGLRRLRQWDRNAPLPVASDAKIPWSEAQSLVLAAFRDFSPEVEAIAKPFFNRNWIDAAVLPSKESGAFCAPASTDTHPFVLLNYQGRPRDVMTLAHELGHGVHQTLASTQGELMADTPLTLAETASVFGETLTFNRLLRSVTGEKERMALLAERVEDMINTMIRQTAFHSYESRVHQWQRAQGELTKDELCDLWMQVQKESLGPAFAFTDGYRSHWAYIPHFIHVPFYVYSYAFGLGLALALYAAYESGVDGFVPKYLGMLAAGGSKHHSELLEPFGISVADPAFWSGGLSMISGYIDELEAMQT